MIGGENLRSRWSWKVGRVEDLIVDRNQIIRGARLLQGNRKKIERPIQKMYPLEVKLNQISPDQENSPELTEETPIRPKHTAAIVAKESFKVIDLFENEDME